MLVLVDPLFNIHTLIKKSKNTAKSDIFIILLKFIPFFIKNVGRKKGKDANNFTVF